MSNPSTANTSIIVNLTRCEVRGTASRIFSTSGQLAIRPSAPCCYPALLSEATFAFLQLYCQPRREEEEEEEEEEDGSDEEEEEDGEEVEEEEEEEEITGVFQIKSSKFDRMLWTSFDRRQKLFLRCKIER